MSPLSRALPVDSLLAEPLEKPMCKNGVSHIGRYGFFGSAKSVAIIQLIPSFKKFKI